MIYRRAVNSNYWHFCQNCPAWPEQRFEETEKQPADALDLCNACSIKVLDGNCDQEHPAFGR